MASLSKDPEACDLVKREDVVHYEVFVVEKLDLILWHHTNGVEELLLVADKLPNEVVRNLDLDELKLLQCVLDPMSRMDPK